MGKAVKAVSRSIGSFKSDGLAAPLYRTCVKALRASA